MVKLEEFNYYLPEELIAQTPVEKRDDSRLMVVDCKNQEIYHRKFGNITEILTERDFLIFNNTRVIPARLWGTKEGTGGKVEVLLLNQCGDSAWNCLVQPGRRVQKGHTLIFANGETRFKGKVIERGESGTRIIRFDSVNFSEDMKKVGRIPLPPYIKQSLKDPQRYQTIYAQVEGSSAAPTAGLHFTEEIFHALKQKGVDSTFITLHIGPGTFMPVKTENIEDHPMHGEFFHIPAQNLQKIIKAKKEGKRIIPVGTTSCRTIESIFDYEGNPLITEGCTHIFIYPGYKFKITQALITNFHLPKSTLLMLVSALAGKELIKKAYQKAVQERYRFFSFGDCMIIL